ncbi:MAG: FAD-dependent oxidoreductase [Patescibacteria group bacterium]
MYVNFDHGEEVATNIRTFWFKPQHPLRYVAGQFVELQLPHPNPDKRGHKRWFTLSSSPSEKLISITTKLATENGSTFKQTLASLKSGAEVTISEAMGDFVLPKDNTLPLVFVAGGIGVTPMRSMVKWIVDNHEQRKVNVIYAARSLDEIAFKELFKSQGINLDVVLSDQTSGWTGRTGRLSGELILEIAGPSAEQLIYVSGPEPMVEALEKDLKSAGVNKHKLILDFFPGYPAP